ncbi:hypothetical protein J7399_14120 [Shimia sp. R9_1]|uniref:hypothetical protein n=1 Tax=unclassified Shimia TaxID=2630038 RepID=UPI001ADAED0D|nr:MULTISPECIES: hypothetical protein [unclassified Shimia]MBO9397466.1 hypothetical protein [Shimia sp. R9_2]MBO9408573.1 hypothetical protein [Shimia sp. R9_1]
MTQTNEQIGVRISENTGLDRAKRLAERVVTSMQAQGYQDIEYILTDCQLTVVASASGKMPKTQYLTLPHGSRRERKAPYEHRFVL